jgi:hypothetical protein
VTQPDQETHQIQVHKRESNVTQIPLYQQNVVGPKLHGLKCLAMAVVSSAIFVLDLDAKVMLLMKTGQMTCATGSLSGTGIW